MKPFIAGLLSTTAVFATTIQVTLVPGDHWHHSFKAGLFTVHTTPQYAFWLEKSDGTYLTTLAVTEKSATSGFTSAKKSSRPEALPVWAHARGEQSSTGNFMPSRKEPLTDAVTTASATEQTVLEFQLPDSIDIASAVLKMEINGSMDFNDSYPKKVNEDHPGYNKGVNGQPSLIYETVLQYENSSTSMDLVGHGEPAGRNGEIDKDISQITTALEIVKTISVTGSSK